MESTETDATQDSKPDDEQEPTTGTDQEQPDDQQPKEGEEQKPARTAEELEADLRKTRNEAAKYRTRLREVEQSLEKAKTPEEVEALLDEIRTTNAQETRELRVRVAGLNAGLPQALWSRLSGETEEELEADAKALAELVGADEHDEQEYSRPGGGLNPREGSEPQYDPVARVKELRKSRYRKH